MERRIFGNIVLISVLAVVGMSFSVDECLADGQTCVRNDEQSATHETCVEWGNQDPPSLGYDFDVDYECTGCYEAPEIELITGDLEWQVWTFVRSGGRVARPGEARTCSASRTRRRAEPHLPGECQTMARTAQEQWHTYAESRGTQRRAEPDLHGEQWHPPGPTFWE